jgi:hypothetical protein
MEACRRKGKLGLVFLDPRGNIDVDGNTIIAAATPRTATPNEPVFVTCGIFSPQGASIGATGVAPKVVQERVGS